MGFIVDESGASIEKRSAATLDYIIDLSRWLAGDRVSATVAPQASVDSGDVTPFSAGRNLLPITVIEDGARRVIPAESAVVLWLTGGTLNTVVRVHVTTADGRVEDFTFTVVIV